MYLTTAIKCPDCRNQIVCEPRTLRIGRILSCSVCGLNFPCTDKEIREALNYLSPK